MIEYLFDVCTLIDKPDQAHFPATVQTDQGENFINTGNEYFKTPLNVV
jgi:hypothetical protein